jgi:hypothetical protein
VEIVFPEEWQEIIHFDVMKQTKTYIADVAKKQTKDLFLTSKFSVVNRKNLSLVRSFIRKMLWIVNGLKFKNNFHKLL